MTRLIPEEATILERAYAAVQEIERLCHDRIQQCMNEIFYGDEELKREDITRYRITIRLCKEFLLVIEEYLNRRDDE